MFREILLPTVCMGLLHFLLIQFYDVLLSYYQYKAFQYIRSKIFGVHKTLGPKVIL